MFEGLDFETGPLGVTVVVRFSNSQVRIVDIEDGLFADIETTAGVKLIGTWAPQQDIAAGLRIAAGD